MSEKKSVSEDNVAKQTDNSICAETKNSIEKLSNFSYEGIEKQLISINENISAKVLCTYYASKSASKPEDMHKLSGVFEKYFTTNGWAQDLYESVDGIDGGQFGYTKDNLKVVVSIHYVDQSTTLTYSPPFPRQFEVTVQISEENQITQNSTQPNTTESYEDTPESKVVNFSTPAYLTNYDKRADGYWYLSFDYLDWGNNDEYEVGSKIKVTNNERTINTFRASSGLSVFTGSNKDCTDNIETFESYNSKLIKNEYGFWNISNTNLEHYNGFYIMTVDNGLVTFLEEVNYTCGR